MLGDNRCSTWNKKHFISVLSLKNEINKLTQEGIEIQGVIKYINEKENPKNEQTPK